MASTLSNVVAPKPPSDTCSFAYSPYAEIVKHIYGSIICFLLILVAFTGISQQWCVLETPPAATFVILFLALILLAYVEGLHYACVCVEKWDMSKYEHTFPRAYRCYKLVDTPQKVKKFLVGRQFFVIFVVFLIAQITSFPGIPPNFLGMPHILVQILIQTGLPGIAIVLTFGQLVSQIFVEEFTIQFLNMYGCEFVIRLSLFTEWIGVCNFSWLLYHISSRIGCRKVLQARDTMKTSDGMLENGAAKDSDKEPVSPTALNRATVGDGYLDVSTVEDAEPLTLFDYVKYAWSTFATGSAVFIVLYGISLEVYVLPTPPAATYIIFFFVLTVLFYLEGLMIAIVATQYWDRETFKDAYPRAYALHELINRPDNVKRFIIGRQFCTVLTGFLLAQICTFNTWERGDYNKVGFYIIIQSGLVGVLITLAFGQLNPELLAQEFPLRFMNMPGSYTIGAISLLFDGVGVGHAAWSVYYATRAFCCKAHMAESGRVSEDSKPKIIRVKSAELLAATGSPIGRVTGPLSSV